MARGVVVVAVREGSFGGITGRPMKVELAAGDIVVFVRVSGSSDVTFVIVVVFALECRAEEMYGKMFCRWW